MKRVSGKEANFFGFSSQMCIIDQTHDMEHKGDGTTKEERLIFKIKHPIFDQIVENHFV